MIRTNALRSAAAAVLVVAMSGCVATPRPAPAAVVVDQAAQDVLARRASAAIDRLLLINAVAQRAVAIFTPWLAPERAARVTAIAARVDAAIAAVGTARDLAAQDGAIAAAETLIAEMKWVAGA